MNKLPLASLCLLALAACSTPAEAPARPAAWPAPTLNGARPLVIAHRGASGERPEHTLEAYRLAIAEGADCIEPDLVMTKDGVLVDRHDTYLSTTTDVARHPEFAGRKRASPDPEFSNRQDWWVADFTLAELKTLRAVQPFRGRSREYDGRFDIPTFAEVLALANSSRKTDGGRVCVYPEAKSPAYHASLGHPMAAPILAGLRAARLDRPGSPIFIQSFEPDFVKLIQPMTELPVILLAGTKADYDHALAMPGAPFWQGAGVTHAMLWNADGTQSGLVQRAHAQGVAVHVWTYRDDAPPNPNESAASAMRSAFALGIDGAFTDFPATGVSVRAAMESGR
jgi:glycerophosphoryl diester phosphodiesterase